MDDWMVVMLVYKMVVLLADKKVAMRVVMTAAKKVAMTVVLTAVMMVAKKAD